MAELNYYETLYLTRPDLTEDELGKVQEKLAEAITNHEGEIFRSDKWSERNLAYKIEKFTKGVYYILIYKALPSVVAEVEKNLRFYNTEVLRFMTVRINKETALSEKAASEMHLEEGGS
ncbi:MAG: 30S ribosomal protein S6 [Candidatus Dadabacteria bacterium]|nr:30S ribosomal protein S6 [Candidatus Dadabacteria bacterium]